MKAIALKLSIVIVLFALIKCEKDNSKFLDINELKASWELERVIEKQTGKIDTLYSRYRISLTFHSENCVSIIGPCKSGPGKFEINENYITISTIALTDPDSDYYEKYCRINFYNTLDFDEIFFNNLNGNYSINGNKLTIISDGDYNLEFTKSSWDLSFACFNEDTEMLIDTIPDNKYYDNTLFKGTDTLIYGKWMLIKKYGDWKPDYDYFEAKEIGIYGVIKNDSIKEYGVITIHDHPENNLLIRLELDENSERFPASRYKYIEHYGSNIMVLRDEATDNYMYHFIRKF